MVALIVSGLVRIIVTVSIVGGILVLVKGWPTCG